MIRPELRDALWRWREVIGALGLAALGIWWALSSFGFSQWLGWSLMAFGLVLAFAGAQKVRFRPDSDGPGVVTLDERRVTYLGPVDGGVADLDLMVQLDLTTAPAWRLINGDGHYLDIPTDARGVEMLFEVFTALPGIKTQHILNSLEQGRTAQMTVWMAPDHKPNAQLH